MRPKNFWAWVKHIRIFFGTETQKTFRTAFVLFSYRQDIVWIRLLGEFVIYGTKYICKVPYRSNIDWVRVLGKVRKKPPIFCPTFVCVRNIMMMRILCVVRFFFIYLYVSFKKNRLSFRTNLMEDRLGKGCSGTKTFI